MNKKTIFVSGILAVTLVAFALKPQNAVCESNFGSAYLQAQGALTNSDTAYDGSGISPSPANGSSQGAFTSSGSSGSQSTAKFTAQSEEESTLPTIKELVGKAKPYLLMGGAGAFLGFCLLGPAGIAIGAFFAIAIWWMVMKT